MTRESAARRPVIFGEVLFDEFMDGSRTLGGAPFNVAWNLQAFGANPLFISRIGNDAQGEKIQLAMSAHGMDMQGLQLDAENATGLVRVSLLEGEPSYDIVEDCAYDHISARQLPPLRRGQVGLVYHGTLAVRALPSAEALNVLLRKTGAPAFVDVNLRKPWYEPNDVLALLQQSRWCKINEAELFELASEDEGLGCDAVAEHLAGHCSNTLFVTRGEQGAIAVTEDAGRFDIRPPSGIEVVDTVGAGDAFCSVLILGVLRNWDIATILERAQDFAAAVVGIHGAVSRDESFYKRFVEAWRAADDFESPL